MKIPFDEIDEIHADSSGGPEDHHTVIVLKTKHAVILPNNKDENIVMTLTLCENQRYYLIVNT